MLEYAETDAGHGALIGRIGSSEYAQAFLIGESKQYDVPVAGRLFLGINESANDTSTAQGSFEVTVEIVNEGSATPVSGITPDLLSKLPRRVTDPEGKPGDMVNVLIVGAQDEVVKASSAAEWVQVDKTVRNTALNAALESFEKKDYLTMQ